MSTKRPRKLSLHRESIRNLSGHELSRARGAIVVSGTTRCLTEQASCGTTCRSCPPVCSRWCSVEPCAGTILCYPD